MSSILRKVLKDPVGAFYTKFDFCLINTNRIISTLHMKIILFSRGISIGSKCEFYGKSYFRRTYLSSITVGSKCRFRSSFLSNSIGLNRPCFISTLQKNAKIEIGNNVGMSGTVIGCSESIIIKSNVLIGGNTLITDFDWHPLIRRENSTVESKPVIIEEDAFIGTNAIILKGAHIGKGSVIGANSVVTGIIPPNVVAGGNPCRVIRKLEINKE